MIMMALNKSRHPWSPCVHTFGMPASKNRALTDRSRQARLRSSWGSMHPSAMPPPGNTR